MQLKEIVFSDVHDFDPVHTFECGQCFRWNKVEKQKECEELRKYEKGIKIEEPEEYIGVVNGYFAIISFDPNNRLLRIRCSGGDKDFWFHYLDLETDYSNIKDTIISCDSRIAKAVSYGYGIRILNQNMFETLISFIISQNNNIPRIKKCIEALCKKYGKKIGEYNGDIYFSFPTPEELSIATEQELSDMKFGYRSKYIIESVEQFIKRGNPKSYEEVLSYTGVGPKVANCMMLFGVHKTDSFPIDTWVKHIMNDMYGFDEKNIKGMQEFAKKNYGKYAGYAQQYLFYFYRDNGK